MDERRIIVQDSIVKEKVLKETQDTPPWLKTEAKWWSENKMRDSDFTEGIEYLIEKKMIDVQIF